MHAVHAGETGLLYDEIGRIVMNDSCDRLMHSKDIQEFYLGVKEQGARGERRWKKKKTWR